MYSLCTDVRPSQDHQILRMQTVQINLAPIGVMTDRSVMDLVKKAKGTTPIGIMLMNDKDVVIEFEKGARVVEISQLLHSIDSCVMTNHYA